MKLQLRVAIPILFWVLIALVAASSLANASKEEGRTDFAEILLLSGWKPPEMRSDKSFTPAETTDLLKLLRRLKTFDILSLDRWTVEEATFQELLAVPEQFQTQLVRLSGQVIDVERTALEAGNPLSLDLPEYYRCEVTLDEGDSRAIVFTPSVPTAWHMGEEIREKVRFSGLLVRLTLSPDKSAELIFVAPRIAWLPTSVTGANRSYGWAILGNLGFDVGLLDSVSKRGPIRSVEREAFYQLLDTVSRVGSHQLARSAEKALSLVEQRWQERLESSGEKDLIAQEVIRQTNEGRYSIVPLFLEAETQKGNLLSLDGVVRRAVRIEVGQTPTGAPSDVWRRFGIDHYYELDLFTEDSQDLPIVFCTPELSTGFPVGEKLLQRVRVAGFFFKSWVHHSRNLSTNGEKGYVLQAVPLLIGPSPIPLVTQASKGSLYFKIIMGGLFVAALAGIWLAAWWLGRTDDEFHHRAIAPQYRLQEGETLDDLVVEENHSMPDFSLWEAKEE